MKKIDKSTRLSTEYEKWEKGLGDEHPPYSSSNHPFYKDIVMDLLRCQQGLCAYTEVQLCGEEHLRDNLWSEGRYVGIQTNKCWDGQLEHFDEQLKFKESDPNSKKQDWLWSNFFMVHSDRNTEKGRKPVNYVLKPDTKEYDPFDLLEYSDGLHYYIPNPKFRDSDPDKWAQIDEMIKTLGLNSESVVSRRSVKIPKAIEFGVVVIEPEFPTAFEFCRRKMLNE